MATIKEIAKKAGVSIGTVDRVLHDRGMVNEQTKNRVLKIIEELDYQPNKVAQGLAVLKKKLRLGFLIPEENRNPFFGDILKAAKNKADELEKYGVQVTFLKLSLHREDTEEYWAMIRKQVSQLDGVALIDIEAPEMNDIVDEANKNGIPIVYFNRYREEKKFLAYVGCDYEKSGRIAVGLCALSGGEDAKVCIYSEYYDEEQTSQSRLRGFKNEMKKRYPNMVILEQRQILDNQIDNYISAIEMLERYPEVNTVYVMNPGDYGICEAIYKADGKHQIRIITNDLVDEQAEMVKSGMIAATVCQEPDKQGEKPLELLFQYLAYGIQPQDRLCYTNLSIHIAQSI